MRPIDWATFLAWRTGRRDIPADAVLLTFDDGLADHADVVFPILQQRSLRGVFFVQTQPLVDPSLNDAHRIHLLMCRLGERALEKALHLWLDSEEPGWRRSFLVRATEARGIYHYESGRCAHMKHLLTNVLPIDLRSRMLADLFSKHIGDPQAWAVRWYLKWEQLTDMQNAGHTIGGHGHRHEPYTRLTAAEQAADMMDCSAVLSERLGRRPRPFSYPYGSCTDDIAHRCAYSGFVNGFTTERRWIGATDDAHRLGRVDTIHIDAFLEREFSCTPP